MPEPKLDTKERILDAAEQLFAELGFSGTSLRAVTSSAGVNLAAVNYHFGSKEALLHAVLARRLGPVNEERLKWLERLETEAGDRPPAVREILRTLFAPALMALPESVARGIAGRIYAEPPSIAGPLMRELFAEVTQRYLAAIERALPDVPSDELKWRFNFVIGAMVQVLSGAAELAPIPGGLGPHDEQSVLQHLLDFAEAGMCAPAGGAR